MLRLISFLYASRHVLLFLFLEGIALFLIIRFNTPQKNALGDRLLNISLSIANRRANVSSYFSLQAENDQLQQNNQQLLEENLQLKAFLQEVRTQAKDSITPKKLDLPSQDPSYELISCRIVQNSTDLSYNFFTLDKGEKDGVQKEMGVISLDGVVGRVIETTENYSMAISLLNQQLKLSIKSLNKDNIGVYQWPGISPREGFAKIIPSDRIIEINDTLVTSGYSHVFPPDYPVGYVDSVGTQTAEGFYEVWINLASDFYKLSRVYIIRNLNKPELDSLSQKAIPSIE